MKKHFNYLSIVLLTLIICLAIGCTDKSELEKFKANAQTQEQNKEIVRNLFAAVDKNDFDKIKSYLADDFTLEAAGLNQPWKQEDLIEDIKTSYASLPDYIHHVEDIIAEGNRLMVKTKGQGTFKNQYQGILPTGKPVVETVVSVITMANGKVKNWWVISDNLATMLQMGMELKPAKAKK
jgi:ketosteroid isomerase-like protein